MAGDDRFSGRATGRFFRLFTIRPVGNVYIARLLNGYQLSIIWVLFPEILGCSEILLGPQLSAVHVFPGIRAQMGPARLDHERVCGSPSLVPYLGNG